MSSIKLSPSQFQEWLKIQHQSAEMEIVGKKKIWTVEDLMLITGKPRSWVLDTYKPIKKGGERSPIYIASEVLAFQG